MNRWTALFVALCIWWTALGHQQSLVWQSNLSLMAHTAHLQPNNLWAQQNFATALVEAKQAHAACEQLGVIQRLVQTDRVVNEEGTTQTQLDAWIADRILALAYFDHQGLGVTACRDDSIYSVASR